MREDREAESGVCEGRGRWRAGQTDVAWRSQGGGTAQSRAHLVAHDGAHMRDAAGHAEDVAAVGRDEALRGAAVAVAARALEQLAVPEDQQLRRLVAHVAHRAVARPVRQRAALAEEHMPCG